MLTPLLLAAALVPPSTEADSSRVAPRVVERRLELDLDPSALNWSGNLVATFEVRGTTRRIRLRFDASRVSRVGLADARGEVSAGWGTDAGGLFMVEADRDLAPGQARLEVAFGGRFSTAAPGLVRDTAATRATLVRGEGAAFPAFPEPLATPWTIVVNAPAGCDVRATGRLLRRETWRGWDTWRFWQGRATAGDSLRVDVRAPARGGPRR